MAAAISLQVSGLYSDEARSDARAAILTCKQIQKFGAEEVRTEKRVGDLVFGAHNATPGELARSQQRTRVGISVACPQYLDLWDNTLPE